MRKRCAAFFVSLALVFVLSALPASAQDDAYHLTPAPVSIETVQAKLISLQYLAADQTGLSASALRATKEAVRLFQRENNLNEFGDMATGDEPMDARTLIRLMAQGVPVNLAVYVPVYGGKRYHIAGNVCGLHNPEMVDVSVARLLGYTECGRCWKSGGNSEKPHD